MSALTELKKELADVEASVVEAEADVDVEREAFERARGRLVDARQVLADRQDLRLRYREATSALERIGNEADRG